MGKFLRISFIAVNLFLSHALLGSDSGEHLGAPGPIRFLAGQVSGVSFGCALINQQDIPGEVVGWHSDRLKKVGYIKEAAHRLRSDKNPNFAMFRIRILREQQVEKGGASGAAAAGSSGDEQKQQVEAVLCDYPNHVFSSGGDLEFLERLAVPVKEGLKQEVVIKCPGNYWSPFPEQLDDGCLRKDIAEVFSFEESITSAEKEYLVAGFKGRIAKGNYFRDMVLTRLSQDKLVDSYRASLHFQLFKEASNAKAHAFRLMDKQSKGSESWHLNDLFGGAFQLNFADSEQAIRAFIYKIEPKELSRISVMLDFSPLSSHIAAYWKLYKEQGGPKPETAELEKISGPIDQELVKIFRDSGVRFSLDIASYYDMCRNCQATFCCDIIEKQNIQKKCLLLLIGTQLELKKEIGSYIVGRLHQYGLAQKIPPILSFLVSYQNDYNP